MRKSVEEIIDTIKAIKGLTKDYEVADSLGVGRGALSNAKQRDSISFLDELVTFCDRENLTLDFIRHDPFISPAGVKTIAAPGAIPGTGGNRYIEASVHSMADATASAPFKQNAVDTVIIPKDIYRDGCMVVQVSGDSMEKLLMDGANAVIDTNMREIASGSIYAFRIPLVGNILRECHSDPLGLSLIPYNKNYPPSSIKWDDFDPEMVIGKVTCSVINVFG